MDKGGSQSTSLAFVSTAMLTDVIELDWGCKLEALICPMFICPWEVWAVLTQAVLAPSPHPVLKRKNPSFLMHFFFSEEKHLQEGVLQIRTDSSFTWFISLWTCSPGSHQGAFLWCLSARLSTVALGSLLSLGELPILEQEATPHFNAIDTCSWPRMFHTEASLLHGNHWPPHPARPSPSPPSPHCNGSVSWVLNQGY